MSTLPYGDITRREDLYKGIIDAPVGFILSKKSSDEIVEANTAACSILQIGLSELKGKKVSQIFTLPNQPYHANILDFAHLNHLVGVARLINAKVVNGTSISVAALCKEIVGTEPLVCTIFWDAKVDTSKELMDHSPVFMGTLSMTGQVLFATTASKALFGLEPEKMHNQQLQKFLHPDDRILLEQCLESIKRGDGAASGGVRIRNTQGDEIYCPITLISETDSTSKPTKVFITAYDNTQVRQQRARDVSLIFSASQAPLNGVAARLHDVNQKLLDLTLKFGYLKTRPLSPASKKAVEEAEGLSREISTKVRKIHSEGGAVEKSIRMHRVLFDLNKLLEEVIAPFKEQMKQKSLELQLKIDPQIGRYFYADAAKIKELLTYTLANSVAYTEEGGKLALRVSCVEEKQDYMTLTFEVEDNGIPIPEDAQRLLFQSHIQTMPVSERTARDAGKLLNLCRAIVHIMAGTFGLSSDQKRGAKFYFTLRMQLGELYESTEPIFSGTVGIFKSLNLRAIVVDDVETNNRISSQILQNLGALEVKCAMNGKEAVALYNQEGADVIFMDIQMPVMDGYDAVRQIRAAEEFTPRHVAIYFSSGTKITHEAAVIAGADGRIDKPFQVKDFFEALLHWRSVSSA